MSPGALYPYNQPDGWLCRQLPHLYFGGMPFSMLLGACIAAANELETKRKRSLDQRWQLAFNVRNLLREISERLTERAAPGSMNWDLGFGHMTLSEAAAIGLEGEYR